MFQDSLDLSTEYAPLRKRLCIFFVFLFTRFLGKCSEIIENGVVANTEKTLNRGVRLCS